jgi:hypothetical protein
LIRGLYLVDYWDPPVSQWVVGMERRWAAERAHCWAGSWGFRWADCWDSPAACWVAHWVVRKAAQKVGAVSASRTVNLENQMVALIAVSIVGRMDVRNLGGLLT